MYQIYEAQIIDKNMQCQHCLCFIYHLLMNVRTRCTVLLNHLLEKETKGKSTVNHSEFSKFIPRHWIDFVTRYYKKNQVGNT